MDHRKNIETMRQFVENFGRLARNIRKVHDRGIINDENVRLCADPGNMLKRAEQDALDMLQSGEHIRPTFVLFSRTGVVAPIVLSTMPSEAASRLAFAAPFSLLLHFAPIDGYLFMSQMWASQQSIITRSPPELSEDRFSVITIRAGTRVATLGNGYTIVRDHADQPTALLPMNRPLATTVYNPCMIDLFDYGNDLVADMSEPMLNYFETIYGELSGDRPIPK